MCIEMQFKARDTGQTTIILILMANVGEAHGKRSWEMGKNKAEGCVARHRKVLAEPEKGGENEYFNLESAGRKIMAMFPQENLSFCNLKILDN